SGNKAITAERAGNRPLQSLLLPMHRHASMHQLDFFVQRHLLEHQIRPFVRGKLGIHPGLFLRGALLRWLLLSEGRLRKYAAEHAGNHEREESNDPTLATLQSASVGIRLNFHFVLAPTPSSTDVHVIAEIGCPNLSWGFVRPG